MRLRAIAAALTIAVVLPRVSFADESVEVRAEALFEEGRRLMAAGQYAAACAKFAASDRLDRGAGTLLNLALCYEKNGQNASAWVTYKDALAEAKKRDHHEFEAQARARIAAIEPTLARLAINVPPASEVPGLVVERDGVKLERDEWSTPIPTDPGVHEVSAKAPDHAPWSVNARVAIGQSVIAVTVPRLEYAPAPKPRAAGPDAGTDPAAGNTQRTLGIVAGGVGIVGIGLGAVFGLMAKGTYDDTRAHCTADNRCDAAGLDAGDKARTQATISTVAFVVGGAALAGGAVLYFTAPSARATALRVTPTYGGGALSWGGAF